MYPHFLSFSRREKECKNQGPGRFNLGQFFSMHDLNELSQQLANALLQKQKQLAVAESCTGGLIAAALTDVPGSSAVLDRGFVTYSNEAKEEMLGVAMDLIKTHGAVSEPVVRAMVSGALAHSRAQTVVAVTGIAGPDGGTSQKPVGLVYIGVQSQDGLAHIRECYFADQGAVSRSDVRRMTVETALEMVLAEIG